MYVQVYMGARILHVHASVCMGKKATKKEKKVQVWKPKRNKTWIKPITSNSKDIDPHYTILEMLS